MFTSRVIRGYGARSRTRDATHANCPLLQVHRPHRPLHALKHAMHNVVNSREPRGLQTVPTPNPHATNMTEGSAGRACFTSWPPCRVYAMAGVNSVWRTLCGTSLHRRWAAERGNDFPPRVQVRASLPQARAPRAAPCLALSLSPIFCGICSCPTLPPRPPQYAG